MLGMIHQWHQTLASHPAKHSPETFSARFLILLFGYRRPHPQNDWHFKNFNLVSGRDVNYGESRAFFGRFVLSPLKWMLLIPSDDFCNFLFPYHCIFNKHSKHKQKEHEKCFSLSTVPVVRPIEVLKQLLNQNRISERDGNILRASVSLSIFSGVFSDRSFAFFRCENNIRMPGIWTPELWRQKDEKLVISKLFIYSFRTCSTGIEFLSLYQKEGKGNKFSRALLKNNFAAKIIRLSIISLFKCLHRYQHWVVVAIKLENLFQGVAAAYFRYFATITLPKSQYSGQRVLQSFFNGEKTLRLFQLFRHFCLRRETWFMKSALCEINLWKKVFQTCVSRLSELLCDDKRVNGSESY